MQILSKKQSIRSEYNALSCDNINYIVNLKGNNLN